MRRIFSLNHGAEAPDDTLELPFESRVKSRMRILSQRGADLVIQLPRGTVLRHGDRLQAEDGGVVLVQAAPEELSRVSSTDAFLLMKAAYHLGNRHIALEIRPDRLQYLHDHVLDHMVEELGLRVECVVDRFEPEGGAYPGHGHSHGSSHEHSSGHGHSHGHGSSHEHSSEQGHSHEIGHDHAHEHSHEQEEGHGHRHR